MAYLNLGYRAPFIPAKGRRTTWSSVDKTPEHLWERLWSWDGPVGRVPNHLMTLTPAEAREQVSRTAPVRPRAWVGWQLGSAPSGTRAGERVRRTLTSSASRVAGVLGPVRSRWTAGAAREEWRAAKAVEAAEVAEAAEAIRNRERKRPPRPRSRGAGRRG